MYLRLTRSLSGARFCTVSFTLSVLPFMQIMHSMDSCGVCALTGTTKGKHVYRPFVNFMFKPVRYFITQLDGMYGRFTIRPATLKVWKYVVLLDQSCRFAALFCSA